MPELQFTRRQTLAAAGATAIVTLSPGARLAADAPALQESHMPLLRIDLYEGRSDDELARLLDTVHAVMLAAFKVPNATVIRSSPSTGRRE